MYIIGENIHIISEKVKIALKERDKKFFQELAVAQVEGGAQALDLNMGPRKKDWEEVFPWMVETVEAVVDVPAVGCPDGLHVDAAADDGGFTGRLWSANGPACCRLVAASRHLGPESGRRRTD